MFYNYKGFHSLVLMAICDVNYCFTFVDSGGLGRDNDAAIFGQSEMGKAFEYGYFDIPQPEVVEGHILPYVIVSDEIFLLKPWLMKPFPRRDLTEEKLIYNYRSSRCRRTIENVFGIFATRWRIFRRTIRASIETVERIIMACVCLHNYQIQTDNACYVPSGFIDSENGSGGLIPGRSAIQTIPRARSNNYSLDARETRKEFKRFFNSPEGSVPWQVQHVRSCGKTLSS